MKNSKVKLVIIVVIAITLSIGIYFIINKNNPNTTNTNSTISFLSAQKDTIITKENYEEILSGMEDNLNNEQELYYLSYSMMYYIMKDGLTASLSGNSSEDAMYVNIYGKTLTQLIDEGKQLMKDNNITLEQYKTQLKDASETK